MVKTTITISDERFKDLEPYHDRFNELLLLGLSQLKIQEALCIYQRGIISLGRAAEMAGVSKQIMMHQAQAVGIHPCWNENMIEEELA